MNDEIPSEHSAASPAPDAGGSILDRMPSGWQFVYNRIHEGHLAAMMAVRDNPHDPEAQAVRRAAAAAVRAFRDAYEKEIMQRLVTEINAIEPGSLLGE